MLSCKLTLKQSLSNELVEDAMKAHNMDLHLHPTALSRDHAMRQAARAQGLLFDHRHFTYAELIERLYDSEGLPGRLIDLLAQTVFVRQSLTPDVGGGTFARTGGRVSPLIDELKGAGLEVEDVARAPRAAGSSDSGPHPTGIAAILRGIPALPDLADGWGLVDQGDRDLAVLARLRQYLTAGTKPALLRERTAGRRA